MAWDVRFLSKVDAWTISSIRSGRFLTIMTPSPRASQLAASVDKHAGLTYIWLVRLIQTSGPESVVAAPPLCRSMSIDCIVRAASFIGLKEKLVFFSQKAWIWEMVGLVSRLNLLKG